MFLSSSLDLPKYKRTWLFLHHNTLPPTSPSPQTMHPTSLPPHSRKHASPQPTRPNQPSSPSQAGSPPPPTRHDHTGRHQPAASSRQPGSHRPSGASARSRPVALIPPTSLRQYLPMTTGNLGSQRARPGLTGWARTYAASESMQRRMAL